MSRDDDAVDETSTDRTGAVADREVPAWLELEDAEVAEDTDEPVDAPGDETVPDDGDAPDEGDTDAPDAAAPAPSRTTTRPTR